ncbi:hypothetical protein [Streptomyces sp. C]|uniref:hypothetical protein n=1 Tax=Streptomyces sp. C TaxID=253839 RepID=UPI0019D715C6|nr:hypothetical protein [Streptomyces sp. C]
MDHEYCFGVESESLKEIVPGTLLGPEGTAVWSVFSAGPSELASLSGGVMGGWSLLENYTVDASICGQVFKGARWMPWHQEPMKDVRGRDRPRGAAN